ncbi:hypothetical protein CPAV1605_244 [seawater metagenome]|uniref:Glycosyl transferase family 25 domain-containing protein n=1 Tax=seawater metagenome TaxID=1561972 RepID=A0A5E8CIR4_9ZZZZ
MLIYCINCIESEDRYQETTNEFIKVGIKDVIWIKNPKDENRVKGCFLSHLDCYNNFLKSDEEYCMIFEDNVKFLTYNYDIIQKIKEYITEIPDFDLFLLGHRAINVIEYKDTFLKGNFLQLNSYLINKKTAQRVVNYYNSTKQFSYIDLFFNSQLKNINIYGLKDRLCIKSTSQSDNKWLLFSDRLRSNSDIENEPSFAEKIYSRWWLFYNKLTKDCSF